MNFGLWLAAVLQMPVTRVPSWGSPAEAQLSPCRAGALGGVHLQGVAQMLFLPHPWEATEEARAKFFAHGCLGVGQPSVLSLHSSLSLLSSTEPHVHCSWSLLLWESAENSSQVPPLLSARVQCRRGHSLAFFSVRITATNKAGLSGGLFLLLL